MVKFNWSTFWIVLVSCFWTMILAFFVELYLVGAMMIVMQASEKQSAQAE